MKLTMMIFNLIRDIANTARITFLLCFWDLPRLVVAVLRFKWHIRCIKQKTLKERHRRVQNKILRDIRTQIINGEGNF